MKNKPTKSTKKAIRVRTSTRAGFTQNGQLNLS
jgi:hypothetical protein